jgi:hypothetical protein
MDGSRRRAEIERNPCTPLMENHHIRAVELIPTFTHAMP